MVNDVAAMINEQAEAANGQWGQSEVSGGCCGGTASSGQGCGCHGPSTMQTGSNAWEMKLAGAIDSLRPLLQAKGGDIELLAIEDKSAVVRISGQGFGDPHIMEQVRRYIKMVLANAVPGFDELVTV